MSAVLIETMTRDRMEEYVRVFMEAFGGEPWNEPWTEEQVVGRLERFMDSFAHYGLAAEENGQIVGFILGQFEQYYDGLRFYIQEFCCARPGQGIGTTLLAELEEELRKEGVVRTYLMTIHGDSTEGYYRRRGYITDPDNIWMYKTEL